MENDDILWQRVRADDGEALEKLFERHAQAIYNHCFRLIGKWDEAEELNSVVFLEAWRCRNEELPPGKVFPCTV